MAMNNIVKMYLISWFYYLSACQRAAFWKHKPQQKADIYISLKYKKVNSLYIKALLQKYKRQIFIILLEQLNPEEPVAKNYIKTNITLFVCWR